MRLNLFQTLGLAILCLAVAPVLAHPQTATESVVYSFCSKANCTDGENPTAGLIQGKDGNFYGTTQGTIFKLTPGGILTTLVNFCPSDECADDEYPNAPTLIQGSDGNLYGTIQNGGVYQAGSIFRLTPAGDLTTLYSFCSVINPDGRCADGEMPTAALVQGNDGDLYGTTVEGTTDSSTSCEYGCGTIYKLTLSGTLTTLYSFCNQSYVPPGCTDGTAPFSPLVQGADGNLYGTAMNGGANSSGTIFKISTTGSFSTIYSFGTQADDGGRPGDLVQASDGNFYGGAGTFFKVTPAGALTILDGISTELTQIALGGDGNFYGIASTQYGEILRISPQGNVTTIYPFCQLTNCADGEDSDGVHPMSAPLPASNGSLYGTTDAGGAHDQGCGYPGSCGTAYEVQISPSLPAPVRVSLSSSQAQPGKPVTASLKVLNAFSLTMQQCYAFQNGTPLGKIPGTYNSSTQLYTFSTTFDAPVTAGIYNYAVTCGGVESGFATLTVGDTTSTTLTATPNPATPPADVTLTATVTRTTGSGTPTGTVTFSVGTTVLGRATLNGSGVSSLSAGSKGVAAGTYPVVATYSGDEEDVGSTSALVKVTVD